MVIPLLALRLVCPAFGADLPLPLPPRPAAPAIAPAAQAHLKKAQSLYYKGDAAGALAEETLATKASTTTAQPWLDGSVILEEMGQRAKAEQWLKAATARTSDPAALAALGWAQWRNGELPAASQTFDRALKAAPRDGDALLGAARVALDRDKPRDALAFLARAADAAPLLDLVPYFEGQAYERLGDSANAAQAYRQAVIADSAFLEARDALGRLDVKRRNYSDAYRQFTRILDSEPRNKKLLAIASKVFSLAAHHGGLSFERTPKPPPLDVAASPAGLNVPVIRVGIGTDALGHPRKRELVAFKCNAAFRIVDEARGKTLARGTAGAIWQVRLKHVGRKGRRMVVADDSGRTVAVSRGAVVVEPENQDTSAIILEDTGKALRGRLEISIFRANLRQVDIVDLENYTEGVLAAEMPVHSPIEALKAQAILARTIALYIKEVSRRHKKDGYDVCDDTHCQVYEGLRAESARSRDVVAATRGVIVTYHGRVAQVIYSSNCGGHTQSSSDLAGWGDVPYWQGIRDSVEDDDGPLSPWKLRQTLKSWPQSFCQPSNDVHPSHYRWTRVVSLAQLDQRVSRRLKLGRLKWIRALRRSPSGNVNAVLFQGTRRNVKVTDEMKIRGLLALGSLRSTQFIIEPEYGRDGKPAAFVFYGGGWGHGVGLCQSGAMGRAEAGQTYDQIIKAYFKGVDIGRLPY